MGVWRRRTTASRLRLVRAKRAEYRTGDEKAIACSAVAIGSGPVFGHRLGGTTRGEARVLDPTRRSPRSLAREHATWASPFSACELAVSASGRSLLCRYETETGPCRADEPVRPGLRLALAPRQGAPTNTLAADPSTGRRRPPSSLAIAPSARKSPGFGRGGRRHGGSKAWECAPEQCRKKTQACARQLLSAQNPPRPRLGVAQSGLLVPEP